MVPVRISAALLTGLCLIALAACSPAPTAATATTAVTETQQEMVPGGLLPHSLYYLSDLPDGVFQVWVLPEDGSTPQQVTSEPDGVSSFDVFPGDQRVAYIAGNRLYLINSDGTGRALLVDGGPVDTQNLAYHYTQKLAGVSWAFNGRVIAYGQNGVHLYFINEQSDFHVVPNEIEKGEDGNLFPVALYMPVSWSPDNNYLLVEIDFIEGGTLGIFSMQTNDVVRLGGEKIVCCQPSWAPDSSSVLVASPMFGITPAGLWRYDSVSGAETELVHHTSEDDTLNFVNWPIQLASGELRYFFNNMAAFPAGEAPLLMVISSADGVGGRALIRSEYWDNYEALWAEDGSLVVAVQPATGVQPSWPRTGPIVIIPASGDPVMPLPANGYALHWGP